MTAQQDQYIHGFTPEEQQRLALLNKLLNERCKKVIEVKEGSKVLDVGSGLGIFSRLLAREFNCQVIGIEKSIHQITTCSQLAESAGESKLVDFRKGSAYNLPLIEEEWASFDMAHTRFLLEHLKDPQKAVNQMVAALKPGGVIYLIDDDHLHFQCYPPVPHFDLLWASYLRSYDRLGNDPFIGRKLVFLLHSAGIKNIHNDFVNFGSNHTQKDFGFFVHNIAAILQQAEEIIVGQGMVDQRTYDTGLTELKSFSDKPGAAIWYSMHLAYGYK